LAEVVVPDGIKRAMVSPIWPHLTNETKINIQLNGESS